MKRPAPSQFKLGQRLGMMRQIEASLARNPKDANARMNYGLLLREENRLGEAVAQLTKAHKFARQDREILSILAETCFEGNKLPEARKYSRKLCEIDPNNIHYLSFYGDVLIAMGKPDQAAEKFERILKHEPDNKMALKQLLSTANMRGDQEQIYSIQKQMRKLDPLDVSAIYHESNTQKNSLEDAHRLEIDINNSIASFGDEQVPAGLYYAKGKIWSDAKDYDRAFEAYLHANANTPQLEDYNKVNQAGKIAIINSKALFTKQFISKQAKEAVASNAPIFIFGMPRSGTTLTESICGAHKMINAGDELPYITSLVATYGVNSPSKEAFIESASLITPQEVRYFGQKYLDSTASLVTKTPHFTDKMPHNFLNLGFMKMILPNASFIHCRRHPLDNCISIFTNSMSEFHNFYKHDLTKLGLYYRQYWQLMQFWRENIPGGFHEVYYEDVVTNTELNARKMIDYIGLDWEDNVMDRQKSQKSVKTLSAWQVRQPVYTSSAGRWRNYEKHLGPLIDALGPVVDEYEAELAALEK